MKAARKANLRNYILVLLQEVAESFGPGTLVSPNPMKRT